MRDPTDADHEKTLPARVGVVSFQSSSDAPDTKYAVVSDKVDPENVVDLLRIWLPRSRASSSA